MNTLLLHFGSARTIRHIFYSGSPDRAIAKAIAKHYKACRWLLISSGRIVANG